MEQDILDRGLAGPIGWLAAVAAFAALLALFLWLRRRIVDRLGGDAAAGAGNTLGWREVAARTVQSTSVFFLAFVAAALAIQIADLGEAEGWVRAAATAVVIVQAALWITRFLLTLFERYIARHPADANALRTASTFVDYAVKLVVWAVALLLILDNIGIDVTALVAGLGIGGLAVGLAAQSAFSDMFAALGIVFDRPFQVGDFIIVDRFEGTVTRIGLATTRLRSLSGEEIVLPNKDLLTDRIRNYQRMQERWVRFNFRIEFRAGADALAALPGVVRAAVEADPRARFDRSHLLAFEQTGFEFENAYFVKSPDYTLYCEVHHGVCLAIARHVQAQGLHFATPGRLIRVEAELRGTGLNGTEAQAPRPH